MDTTDLQKLIGSIDAIKTTLKDGHYVEICKALQTYYDVYSKKQNWYLIKYMETRPYAYTRDGGSSTMTSINMRTSIKHQVVSIPNEVDVKHLSIGRAIVFKMIPNAITFPTMMLDRYGKDVYLYHNGGGADMTIDEESANALHYNRFMLLQFKKLNGSLFLNPIFNDELMDKIRTTLKVPTEIIEHIERITPIYTNLVRIKYIKFTPFAFKNPDGTTATDMLETHSNSHIVRVDDGDLQNISNGSFIIIRVDDKNPIPKMELVEDKDTYYFYDIPENTLETHYENDHDNGNNIEYHSTLLLEYTKIYGSLVLP